MTGRKVCPCVDCGVDVDVHKGHPPLVVRCPEHKEARKKVRIRAAQARYVQKRRSLGQSSRTRYSGNCAWAPCGNPFTGMNKNQRFCSRSCASKHVCILKATRIYHRPCEGCGTPMEVHPSHRYPRCPPCKEGHKKRLYERHLASRRNVKRIDLGEAPYEDYVVVGPTWCSRPTSYGWRVTAKHKSNSNRREMSLAHYNLSVKLGRRVRDREWIVFLDDDVDNCEPENLVLETEKKKEVA